MCVCVLEERLLKNLLQHWKDRACMCVMTEGLWVWTTSTCLWHECECQFIQNHTLKKMMTSVYTRFPITKLSHNAHATALAAQTSSGSTRWDQAKGSTQDLRGCLGADDRGELPWLPHSWRQTPKDVGDPCSSSFSDLLPSAPAVLSPFAHQTRLPGAFARVLLAPGRLPKDSCTTICTLLVGTHSCHSSTCSLPGLVLTLRCQPRPRASPASCSP